MSAGAILTAVGAVLTLTGLLGTAYAVFRSTSVGRTIEIYQAENAALGVRATRLEAEVEEQRREALREREKRAALEAAVGVLRETLSGEAAVARLGDVIAREEMARREEHRHQVDILERILTRLAPAP